MRDLLMFALVVTLCGQSRAATILAQNGPHVVFNSIPFVSPSGNGEYQEIYSASLFSGPVQITSFAFSPDVTGVYSANVSLSLTTTNVAVGSLSPNLASNYTTPLIVVLNDPAFSENVIGGSETFSLVFNLAVPFLYNPSSGNLLLDLSVSNVSYSGSGMSRSDAGPVISRAWNTAGFANGADTVGLRTEIGLVPEPSTLLLGGIGMLFLIWRLSRRKI